jgi:plastocyanin
MYRKLLNKIIVWLCCGIMLGGCNSSPNGHLESGSAAQDRSELQSNSEQGPVTHHVEIKEMKFQPAALVANKGDTIIFTNNDLVAHDVTEEANKEWSSSELAPGKSWSLIVNKSAAYYCSIHQVMKGKIILK